MQVIDIETPHGVARAHVHPVAAPRAALVLGHGAGGGIAAPDLVTAAAVANELAISVALVEQPYRVAGRRSPPPAAQLDAAWIAVVAHLSGGVFQGLPIVVGGRSSGARVACRTSPATGAVGVLCLAFPLRPPRRANGTEAPSRQPELRAVTVPMLIVQGVNDPFGMPRGTAKRRVVRVDGDHSLRRDQAAIAKTIRGWLLAEGKGIEHGAFRHIAKITRTL